MRSCLGDDDLVGGSEDVTSGSRRRGWYFLVEGYLPDISRHPRSHDQYRRRRPKCRHLFPALLLFGCAWTWEPSVQLQSRTTNWRAR